MTDFREPLSPLSPERQLCGDPAVSNIVAIRVGIAQGGHWRHNRLGLVPNIAEGTQMVSSDSVVDSVRRILAGDHDSFGTFCVVGDPNRWVQYMPGEINAAYPFSDDPSQRLAALPDFAVVEWTSGQSVTGDLMRFDPEPIAEWIDRYFCDVLGCAPSYELTIKLEL